MQKRSTINASDIWALKDPAGNDSYPSMLWFHFKKHYSSYLCHLLCCLLKWRTKGLCLRQYSWTRSTQVQRDRQISQKFWSPGIEIKRSISAMNCCYLVLVPKIGTGGFSDPSGVYRLLVGYLAKICFCIKYTFWNSIYQLGNAPQGYSVMPFQKTVKQLFT